jgi:hypothetical protein
MSQDNYQGISERNKCHVKVKSLLPFDDIRLSRNDEVVSLPKRNECNIDVNKKLVISKYEIEKIAVCVYSNIFYILFGL